MPSLCKWSSDVQILLDDEWVVLLGLWNNISEVSVLFEATPFELVLKLIQVSLLDWIDSSEDIPVNVLSAWWCGDGSNVGPSVVSVSHHHELSVWNQANLWAGVGGSPLKSVEEFINELDLLGGDALVIVPM